MVSFAVYFVTQSMMSKQDDHKGVPISNQNGLLTSVVWSVLVSSLLYTGHYDYVQATSPDVSSSICEIRESTSGGK